MIDKIAILGDFNPIHATLHALNDSTRAIQKKLNKDIQFDWIATDTFNTQVVFEKQNYKGLWVAPGSPYKDMDNVIAAIRYCRINNIPTFGNCGGFQHMVIEFAKHACQLQHADHEETNPNAEAILIKKLSCSLKGQEEELTIIDKDSHLYRTLGKEKLLGRYYCSYGLNEKYVPLLKKNGMHLTSQSMDGNYRSFEIKSHPFFVGTLFQPSLTSTPTDPNPIIMEFVKKSLEHTKIATLNS
jgi:CTP synthase (UTP-ammonia lyase)